MVNLKVIQVGKVMQLPTAKKIVSMIDGGSNLASLPDAFFQKFVKNILSTPKIRKPQFDNEQNFTLFS